MKNKVAMILMLILSLLLLTGCGSTKQNYDLHFKDELVIDYKSNDSPLLLIDKIGNVEVTKEMIVNDSIRINNFIVTCSSLDSNDLGTHTVKYQTNESSKEIVKQVIVKDISSPNISLEKDSFEIFIDELDQFNIYDLISVTDLGDDNPSVTIELDDLSIGKHIITIIATDNKGNTAKKEFYLTLNERPIIEPEIDENIVVDNNDGSSSNDNQGNNFNISTDNSYIPPIEQSKPSNKSFLFSEGYTMGGGINPADIACFNYLKASGLSGSCSAIYSDGLPIGMEAIFD